MVMSVALHPGSSAGTCTHDLYDSDLIIHFLSLWFLMSEKEKC